LKSFNAITDFPISVTLALCRLINDNQFALELFSQLSTAVVRHKAIEGVV